MLKLINEASESGCSNLKKLGGLDQILLKRPNVGLEKRNTLLLYPSARFGVQGGRMCGYQGVSTPCWFGLPWP